MTRLIRIQWFAAILCAFSLCGFYLALADLAGASGDRLATTCPAQAEDDGNWNWAKCGNHQRGVVTLDGDPRVVGPCQFNRLWHQGKVRYTLRFGGNVYTEMTPYLRGDKFARALTDCPWRNR